MMSDDENMSFRCQVLVWPTPNGDYKTSAVAVNDIYESPKWLSPEHPGWVIGWNDNSHQVNVLICAGIISFCDRNEQSCHETTSQVESISKDFNLLDASIRKLQASWRDNCTKKADPSCYCPGCICLARLCILGYWSPKGEDDGIDTSLANLLPLRNNLGLFRLTEQGPWFTRCDSSSSISNQTQELPISSQRQLLLYDPLRSNKGSHYCSPNELEIDALAQSMHSRLLLRISQADDILNSLRARTEEFKTGKHPLGVHHTDQQFPTTKEGRRSEEVASSIDSSSFEPFKRCAACCSLAIVHFLTFVSPERHWSSCMPICRFTALVTARTTSRKSAFFTRQEMVQHRVTKLNASLSAVIDGVLGLLVGIAILTKRELFASICRNAWSVFHHKLLKANIGWLEAFPIGVKLNSALTKYMGYGILAFCDLQESLLTMLRLSSFDGLWIMATLAGCVALTFGLSSLIAFLFDVLRFSTLHVALLAAVFRNLYRAELYLLAALWRVFRGKKQNYLRRRTDTMEYDATQLLLGMILFSMVVFLFTTIFVYYLFFAILDLLLTLVLVLLWLSYAIQRNFPYGSCVLRMKHPGWFVSNVYFEDINAIDDSGSIQRPRRIVTLLVSTSSSSSSIVWGHLSPSLSACLSAVPSLFVDILPGRRGKILDSCLQQSLKVR